MLDLIETFAENWPLVSLAVLAALCFILGTISYFIDRPKNVKTWVEIEQKAGKGGE